MKRVWLIRHGQHDWLGKSLVGRKAGVGLNDAGRRQAHGIADALRAVKLAAIYSSPQQRALETAVPLARVNHLAVAIEKDLDEIDFGAWTGRTFDDLNSDPLWERWNSERGSARARGGEAMEDVQKRIVRAVQRLARPEPIAFFSHGDVIRAAILWFMGRSLDEILSIDVEPGAAVLLELLDEVHARVTWQHEVQALV